MELIFICFTLCKEKALAKCFSEYCFYNNALNSTPMSILKNSTCLRGVGVDVVEDVDEDEEEGDEERHAARYDVGGDEEADPGHEHEQTRGEVVGDDVGHHVPGQLL